jgi:hypothetical protein
LYRLLYDGDVPSRMNSSTRAFALSRVPGVIQSKRGLPSASSTESRPNRLTAAGDAYRIMPIASATAIVSGDVLKIVR